MAIISIIAQVTAGFPNLSLKNPATIPPTMPPTSNKVDKYAADSSGIPLKKRIKNILDIHTREYIFFINFRYEVYFLVCI